MIVRDASPADARALAELNERYMRETFRCGWNGTAARLAEDMRAGLVALSVAELGADLRGFATWLPSYDLHHCVRGAVLADLYVVPAARGRGVAPALVRIAQRRPDVFDRPARAPQPAAPHRVISRPVLGGLHHGYGLAA